MQDGVFLRNGRAYNWTEITLAFAGVFLDGELVLVA